MKKAFHITFFLFFLVSSAFSQSESLRTLIEKSNELNLDMWELTTFAEKNIQDKETLAKFFYYWIGVNIQYDNETFSKIINGTINNEDFWKSQEAFEVYNNRKGVCAGYANLYKWFLDWVEIEAVVISGHIRDYRNHYVTLESDDNFRHAWNAIKFKDKWVLVDTTWGTSTDSETSDYYFDIKPEFLIITHYPEAQEWQLLEEPLTLQEFNNSQFIKPIWFMIGFTAAPKLMKDQEFYYFTFEDLLNNHWSVGLSISKDNINFEPINDIVVINQDGSTYFRFGSIQVPKTAYFKVNIAKFENVDGQLRKTIYDDVINFKL